jgi:hypothetical protein
MKKTVILIFCMTYLAYTVAVHLNKEHKPVVEAMPTTYYTHPEPTDWYADSTISEWRKEKLEAIANN